MKKLGFLFFIASLLTSSIVKCEETSLEDDVIVLDSTNFKQVIESHFTLMVEFYAPWCTHCKTLAPEYSQAARILKYSDPPYFMAKVDATVEKQLAEEYGVKGYPTIIFFKGGQQHKYTGGVTAPDIAQWYLKRAGPASIPLQFCEEISLKAEQKKLSVVYIGDQSKREYNDIFIPAAYHASLRDQYYFYDLGNQTCASSLYNVTETPVYVLLRQFDESPILFYPENGLPDDWQLDSFLHYLKSMSKPLVTMLDDNSLDAIFSDKKDVMILFTPDGENVSKEKYRKIYGEAAKILKNDIMVYESGISQGLQQKVAEFFGVKTVPQIWIVQPSFNFKKFIYQGDLEQLEIEDLQNFYSNFSEETLTPFFKSQPVPTSQTTKSQILVGTTFKTYLSDHEQVPVFILFYDPSCGHCQKLLPIWLKIAEQSSSHLAQINWTENEVDEPKLVGPQDIDELPTIRMYSKGEAVQYKGEKTFKDISQWIQDNSKVAQANDEL